MSNHFTRPEFSWPTNHSRAIALRLRMQKWAEATGVTVQDLFLAAGYSCDSNFIRGIHGIGQRRALAVIAVMDRYPHGWSRFDPPTEFKELCRVIARRLTRDTGPVRDEGAWIEQQRREREEERRRHEQYWLAQEKPPLGGARKRSIPLSQMIA